MTVNAGLKRMIVGVTGLFVSVGCALSETSGGGAGTTAQGSAPSASISSAAKALEKLNRAMYRTVQDQLQMFGGEQPNYSLIAQLKPATEGRQQRYGFHCVEALFRAQRLFSGGGEPGPVVSKCPDGQSLRGVVLDSNKKFLVLGYWGYQSPAYDVVLLQELHESDDALEAFEPKVFSGADHITLDAVFVSTKKRINGQDTEFLNCEWVRSVDARGDAKGSCRRSTSLGIRG